MRELQTGTAAAPRYGLYACYSDKNNDVVVVLDLRRHVYTTDIVVNGTQQGWRETALPPSFNPQREHTLAVRKDSRVFMFFLDGMHMQTRLASLVNGQMGLLTSGARVRYRAVRVSGTF